MPFEYHTIEVPDAASTFADSQKITMMNPSASNAAGGGAGQTVTVTGFQNAFVNLPNGYDVLGVDAGQSVTYAVTSKTSTGFTLTLTPNPATATIASGTVTVLVVG